MQATTLEIYESADRNSLVSNAKLKSKASSVPVFFSHINKRWTLEPCALARASHCLTHRLLAARFLSGKQ